VTVLAVATIVPEVDPVRTLNIIVSEPSVVKSELIFSTTLAVFALIVNAPLLTPSLKSGAVVVPELVQYNVVPLLTFDVLIVNVTEPPSFTDVVDGITE
jgi:hypothetical protein